MDTLRRLDYTATVSALQFLRFFVCFKFLLHDLDLHSGHLLAELADFLLGERKSVRCQRQKIRFAFHLLAAIVHTGVPRVVRAAQLLLTRAELPSATLSRVVRRLLSVMRAAKLHYQPCRKAQPEEGRNPSLQSRPDVLSQIMVRPRLVVHEPRVV